MALSPQTFVGNIDIGTFLKIYSSNGVYNNLSTASDMWKFFLKLKASPAGGRQLKYLLRTGYGPAAVQSLPAGSSGDYPAGARSGLQEGTAEYKDFGLTVNVPRNLLNKTGNDLLQYADPLTEELDAKSIAAARVMSHQSQGDGSGAIGRISSTTAPTVVSARLSITLSTASADAGRSHIGWWMEDDYVKFATEAGVAQDVAVSSGTVAYYKVESIDQDADQVTLSARNSAGTELTVTTIGTIEDGDYAYRIGTTANDLTAIGTADYNTLSECLVGMESLTANDGRKVNGITHSGAIQGSRRDAGGAAIDSSDFQRVLSLAKRKAGRGRYKYKNAFMFDTVYDALVESRETDRRFQSVEDGKRGVKMLGYQHGADFVEFCPDEFVSKQRVWMLPESKEVLEFHGKDFEIVEPNKGQKFHLKTSSTGAGHQRQVQMYQEGMGVIVVKHAAAIACITNFSAT
jgi:hypothetical protein